MKQGVKQGNSLGDSPSQTARQHRGRRRQPQSPGREKIRSRLIV